MQLFLWSASYFLYTFDKSINGGGIMDKFTIEQINNLTDNIKLAYYIAHKWDVKLSGRIEKEDVEGVCLLGLTKAVLNYNPNLSKFSTFAIKCMDNEILMALRKVKHKIDNKVISELAFVNEKGDYIPYNEIYALIDPYNAIDEWVNVQSLNDALRVLHSREKEVIMLQMNDISQKEIAKIRGCTQSYVSRIVKRGYIQLKKEMDRE